MKKFRNLLIAVFAVILLAGCSIDEHVSLDITSDKKVQIVMKMGVDDAGIDYMLSLQDMENGEKKEYTDEDRMKYLEEYACESVSEDENSDASCETFKDEKFKGIIIKSDKKDIDTLTGVEGDAKVNIAAFEGSFEESKLFIKDGDVYKSNFSFDLANAGDMTSSIESAQDFVFTFDINLPNKSISNNATKVSDDGLTLSWDLSKIANSNIEFSFKFDENAKPDVTTNTGDDITKKATDAIDNTRRAVEENVGKILGMTKTTFIIVCVSVVAGLILISVLIIVFARKSTNASNSSSNNSASSETAKLFTNPTLSTPTPGENNVNTANDTEPVDQMNNNNVENEPTDNNNEQN